MRLAGAPGPGVPPNVEAALPIPARVPGTVHLDLLDADLILDPYLDDNEEVLAWIGHQDWLYECDIDAPAHWFADGRLRTGTAVHLEFDGLDTVATVSLNGTEIAQTQNMHRRYTVPLADTLQVGSNRLQVRFDSAWRHAEAYQERSGAQPNAYPTPFNFIRKNASNFGWDWGPTLVTAGVWREARLVHVDGGRLASVRPTATVESSVGTVVLDVEVEVPPGAPEILHLTATIDGGTARADVAAGTARLQIDVPDPRLWWPVGLGDQPLYEVSLTLTSADAVVDHHTTRVGFRTLRLVTEPDEHGTSFGFEINGAPVPIRGANWIPDDCFLPRVDRNRLKARIGQAVEANLNLLRVWGGGVYESEDFYAECDERGVLVWQDFLFACAGYPEDEPLRSEVIAEAKDNVARLMPHPSLVLWNGNNECLWGFQDWQWQPILQGREWGRGYYLEDLPAVVAQIDPSRPYWPGSPYSGSEDLHPNDPAHGCAHEWRVWNRLDYTEYRSVEPRFVSEFGWQGPPTWSTLTRAVHDDPLTPSSPGMRHHQKAEDGNGKLARGLQTHLDVPTDITDWHFAMQLNQARAIAFGLEHFRSLRPKNQGAIVWQLNDCWPVTSWAAVDGDGRKKPLWYALRQAFAPRLLTVQPDAGGGLVAVAVNDLSEPWQEEVTVSRIRVDGTVQASGTLTLAAPGFGACRLPLPAALSEPGDVSAELLVLTSSSGARAIHAFAEDRDLAYQPLDVEVEVERTGEDVVVSITARGLVRDLCLFADRVSPEAEADQALITLLPGESAAIRVSNVPPGREGELTRYPVLRAVNDLVRHR